MRNVRVAVLLAVIVTIPAVVAVAVGASRDTAAANRASARVEAARLLGLLHLPAGTARSATDPIHGLRQPTYDEATPNLVDAHAWWTTSASSSAVLAYVAAHRPPGAKRYTFGFSGGPAGTVTAVSETFSLPPVAGALTERVLGVTVVPSDAGVTAIRTDGEAVWLTPRPSWERIPAGVRSVVFTGSGQRNDGRVGPISAPRTITGDRARRLVSFINRDEVAQPGVSACPAAFADSVNLQFLGADGTSVARAVEDPTGCASVTLTIGRRTGPVLSDYPSVTDELIRLGAFPVCAAGELSASASLPGRNGPVTARVLSFSFQNRSDVMCRLSGFPRLVLFDAAGHRLSITLTDQGASIVRGQGLGATSVLDPNQSAGFGASYTECAGARVAVRTQVTLPGVARPFGLMVGSARKPFAPCHGAVGVGNL